MLKSRRLALEWRLFNFLNMKSFESNAFWAMGVLALFFAGGPVARAEEAGNSAAEFCPVLTDEKIDPSIFTDYQGRRIFFCCIHCKQEFFENPPVYLPWAAAQNDSRRVGPTLTAAGAWGGRLIRFAGKFHPLAVHFPIALLVVALIAEGLGFRAKWQDWQGFRAVARLNLRLGAAGAAVAAALGWAAAFGSGLSGEMGTVLSQHRWTGTLVAVLALAAVLMEGKIRKGRWRVMAVLFVLAVLVGVAGHLGGTLVYGRGYLSW